MSENGGTHPREVVIDGVRYVPAAQAVPGVDDVLRVLAEIHWGVGAPEAADPERWRELRVVVADEAKTLPDKRWNGHTLATIGLMITANRLK